MAELLEKKAGRKAHGHGRHNKGEHKRRHGRKPESLKPGSLKYVWNSVSHNKSAVAGMIMLAAIVILCILSPYICPWPYAKMNMPHAYQGPNLTHLLGTDHIGRDLLSRVLYGARYTLIIGIIATVISAVLGILMGAIAGYFGGFIDSCLMRFLDIFQAFPTLILAMAFCAIFGKGVDKSSGPWASPASPALPG